MMDWFERLTGFRERGYAETRARLEVSGQRLISHANGRHFAIGELELPSLAELRLRGAEVQVLGRLRACLSGFNLRRLGLASG